MIRNFHKKDCAEIHSSRRWERAKTAAEHLHSPATDRLTSVPVNENPDYTILQQDFNYTFELTYEDLFLEVNNDILFLMFYDPWNPKIFKFGKNFLMKYNFIFQLDPRNIGFMNFAKKEEKKEEQKEKERRQEIIEQKKKMDIIWIIILSVLLAGIIIGVFVGKKIWDKNRKKRANELLDDDYEYKSTDNGVNKDEAIIN